MMALIQSHRVIPARGVHRPLSDGGVPGQVRDLDLPSPRYIDEYARSRPFQLERLRMRVETYFSGLLSVRIQESQRAAAIADNHAAGPRIIANIVRVTGEAGGLHELERGGVEEPGCAVLRAGYKQ